MPTIVVRVPGRTYPVDVAPGALAGLPARVGGRACVVVSSPRVWALHGRPLRETLGDPVLVPDGERAKTRATLAQVHDALLARGVRRDAVVVALGGGVVTDLAGFAAATWMRGVAWIAAPTTLLAMSDAAIGGKVGINHPRGKNLIGAFHQPDAVVSDTRVLATLPVRELRSGSYEILKSALIGDAPLLPRLETAGPADAWDERLLTAGVLSAARIKAGIVSRDEREGGLRRVLNLGHTVGHALEAVTSFRRFRHGEAVGWGLVAVAEIALRRGLLTAAEHERLLALVDGLGPRPRVDDLDAGEILAAVSRDKKARAGTVPFILPRGLGRVVIVEDVARAELRAALGAMRRRGGSAGSPSARAAGSRPRRTRPTAARR